MTVKESIRSENQTKQVVVGSSHMITPTKTIGRRKKRERKRWGGTKGREVRHVKRKRSQPPKSHHTRDLASEAVLFSFACYAQYVSLYDSPLLHPSNPRPTSSFSFFLCPARATSPIATPRPPLIAAPLLVYLLVYLLLYLLLLFLLLGHHSVVAGRTDSLVGDRRGQSDNCFRSGNSPR